MSYFERKCVCGCYPINHVAGGGRCSCGECSAFRAAPDRCQIDPYMMRSDRNHDPVACSRRGVVAIGEKVYCRQHARKVAP